MPSPWIVLKFGGTSVSSRANWEHIARVVAERRSGGARVLVVQSALSGVTDELSRLLAIALERDPAPELAALALRHRECARDLSVATDADLEAEIGRLDALVAGAHRSRAVSDRLRAEVLACGELIATRLGARFLAGRGLEVRWEDARSHLLTQPSGATARAEVLSAQCGYGADPAWASGFGGGAGVVVTQGFIARDAQGGTVLLGRGGSDTSAAYFAAKLAAQRLEIWTDVPGLFSANPHATPTARLLRALQYDEAQEIASGGARVLHPRCILPLRQSGIPLHIRSTPAPGLPGTVVSAAGSDRAQVKAVCIKKGITLVSMETAGMWHQVGFLADVFRVFREHGLSVDLVSTSETCVTVSLDPGANALEETMVQGLVADLSRLCRVQVIGPCAAVSLVGRSIRAILHQLGDAFAFFAEQKIHLVSQAANDLNFTVVVDEEQGDRLLAGLHEQLIRPVPGDPVLGPSWQQLFAPPADAAAAPLPWWRSRRAALLDALGTDDCAFVYDLDVVRAAARALRGLGALARVHYSVKANPHPTLLRALHAEGIDFECVSLGEVRRVCELFPRLDPARILYTPNFAPRAEYAAALAAGVRVTLDNGWLAQEWGELFAGRELFVRVDTGVGRGHHTHVRTAGSRSKFGVPLDELPLLARRLRAAGARVVGLEAHVGSGIFDVTSWEHTARQLALAIEAFPGARVIDIGGGLGVPERPDQLPVDLGRLGALLAQVRAASPGLEIWMEPGRYLVAAAGVLLARVTQLKAKGGMRFVGVATGMNSLIRPALYGSFHEIVNLTRLDAPATGAVSVVGPICESADVLGHERLLADCAEGDVLLIANAGAYGHAMSSTYNLREPAPERFL